MNVARAKDKLFTLLSSFPDNSVTPEDVVVLDLIRPAFEGPGRAKGGKLVPCACVWAPGQDRLKGKPNIQYEPRVSRLASPRRFEAARAQSRGRAKLLQEWIAEYNNNPELRKQDETV